MDDDEAPGAAGHGFLAADALAAGSALTPGLAEPILEKYVLAYIYC